MKSHATKSNNSIPFFQATVCDSKGNKVPVSDMMIIQALQDAHCQVSEHPFCPELAKKLGEAQNDKGDVH
ncbi:MAG: hypothetical protein K6L73_04720 [Cellvibrionaceae bacterium]